jgi:hypothetical protein
MRTRRVAGSRQETPKPGTGYTARVLELEGPMRGGFTQTSEARAPVTEIQDRLIDLYVQQDEAPEERNPDRARELQAEIDKATARREELRRRAPS